MNTTAKNELIKAIIKEIDQRKNYLNISSIETIYFGGGTPSILSASELESILEKINKEFDVNSNAEITIECNPDDLSKQKLNELMQLSFNRLSIGLQSFNAEELKWMNRAHTAGESLNSVKAAQDAGFDNISIDLIYGSKFQDELSWIKTLETAVDLHVQHISAYNLTIESKTKLGVKNQKGLEPPVNEERSAEQFKKMIAILESSGFIQYEISNFGKKGFFSKHNSSYWLGVPYMGLGPSAHSYNGLSRQWNISSNSAYVDAINKAKIFYEAEILTDKEKYNEYVLTRLRTIWGCDRKEIEQKFGKEVLLTFDKCAAKHKQFFDINQDVITLNLEGKLRADFLAAEFFV